MYARPVAALLATMLATLPGALCLTLPASASAQADYPSKPIRLIVGFAAGGISDVLARALSVKLSQQLGQQVLVENKQGAGTTIASDFIAKAPPDGYTLFLQDITTHAINATLHQRLPYDSVKDFTPVGLVASTPLMLVVHSSNPARNLSDLTAQIKSSPGKYSYASSGIGAITHLAGEMMKIRAGLDIVQVPYKGSAPATQAILGNEVTFTFSTMPPAIANVKAGKLRAIAVTAPKRTAAAPEVPTMIEAGMKDFDIVLYSGILAPPGMAPALVRRINAAFAKVVGDNDIKTVYANIGAEPMAATPEFFADMLSREITKLAPVVRASGAKVE